MLASVRPEPGAENGAAVVKMGPQSDLALLGRLPARIARIEECANRERSKFYGSHLVQDAVVRNLQTIAESTQRVSDGLRATEPDVASRAVAGFATCRSIATSTSTSGSSEAWRTKTCQHWSQRLTK